MNARRLVAVSAVCATALVSLTTGCARGGASGGGEDQTYAIKFSHVTTESTPKGQAAVKFKELVEEKTGGKVTVEIFPNSELYGDEDELQALQSGAVQVLAPASSKFTTIAPALQVLDLPFLFDSPEDVAKEVTPDSPIGKAIFDNQSLVDRGIKPLGLWDNGFKQLSANSPIGEPADLDGLSFRIQPSDVLRAQFDDWGAQTTPMAFGEVYNALQQGVIDGQENTWSNIESQKFYTVQSEIAESDHGYLGYVLVINEEFFASLPDDLRSSVQEAADEATAYNREIAADLNEKAKQTIVDSGETNVVELTDAERQAFEDAVVPSVWEQFADVVGPELVDQLVAQREEG